MRRNVKPEAVMKMLTRALLAELKVGQLPPQKEAKPAAVETPPIAKKDPVVVEPPPLPPPVVPVDDGAGQRAAGQGLLAAGVAVAVVGGIVTGVGAAVGGGVKVDGYGNAASLREVETMQVASGLVTAGLIGAGVGAVTAIIGGIVWGTAPEAAPRTNVSVSPTPGGAMLQVGGTF